MGVSSTVANLALGKLRSPHHNPQGPVALLLLLEQGQQMLLTAASDTELHIVGASAHALAPLLQQVIPTAQIKVQGTTKCNRVSGEALIVRVPAPSTKEALESHVRCLLLGIGSQRGLLARLALPNNLLLPPQSSRLPRFPRSSSQHPRRGWLLREEGPDARHPGAPPREWEDAYHSPANTLAVTGPRTELACVLGYARLHGAAPISVQLEELPPLPFRLNFATPAIAAAATSSGSGGLLGTCSYKREQANGNYYGHWTLKSLTAPAGASDAEKEELEEDRIFMEEMMAPWNERIIKNNLEGKLCMVPPCSTEILLSLRLRCGVVVEYEDFCDLQGKEVFCVQGPVGAGRERLWNPAFPDEKFPTGFIDSEAPEYSAQLLVLSLGGAAFAKAKCREAVEVLLNQGALSQLEGSRALRHLLHMQAFRARREHVHPEPLPDWRGEAAVEGVTPVPFCGSLQPILLKIATAAELRVSDIEDWAKQNNEELLSCSQCHRGEEPECQARMNAQVPGLVTMRASREDRIVATFPSEWRAAAARPRAAQKQAIGCAALENAERTPALPPPAPAATQTMIASFSPQEQEHLRQTFQGLIVCEEAAESLPHLARFLLDHGAASDQDRPELIQKSQAAVARARSAKALTGLVVTIRLMNAHVSDDASRNSWARTLPELQDYSEEERKHLLDFASQIVELRSCEPQWNLEQTLPLAALADTAGDARALASLLHAVRARPSDEDVAIVACWVNNQSEQVEDEVAAATKSGLLRIHRVLEDKRKHEQLKKRDAFVEAIVSTRHSAPSWHASRRGARFLLSVSVPGAVQSALSADPTAWGSKALLTWAQRTSAWDESEAAAQLQKAACAGIAAHAALKLLADHNSPEAFADSLQELSQGRAREAPPVPLAGGNHLTPLERAHLQLTPPEAGDQRLQDALEQPEHQALLLAHSVRELLALWASLALHDVMEIGSDEVAAVLRGGRTYLLREKQYRPALPRAEFWMAHPQLDRELLQDILIRGSASLSHLTGGCVPRRAVFRE